MSAPAPDDAADAPSTNAWADIILAGASPDDTWTLLFDRLKSLATTLHSPVQLHEATVAADRLLAESAWELWQQYEQSARRTAPALVDWWSAHASGPSGRAILILDALSLREVSLMFGEAQARGMTPDAITVTGAEVPTETDRFAQALGIPSRSSLSNNGAPGGFALKVNGEVHTDVMSHAFEDCVGSIPAAKDVFIWHSWLDDLIHVHKRLPDQIHATAEKVFKDDGFWSLVDRMRQGRSLLITSDHGYAVSKQFSTEISDDATVAALRETFGASRARKANQPWGRTLMPPLVLSDNAHHVVMGQTKWKAPGGFPHVCHGGLSLLEVAVPFIELPAK